MKLFSLNKRSDRILLAAYVLWVTLQLFLYVFSPMTVEDTFVEDSGYGYFPAAENFYYFTWHLVDYDYTELILCTLLPVVLFIVAKLIIGDSKKPPRIATESQLDQQRSVEQVKIKTEYNLILSQWVIWLIVIVVFFSSCINVISLFILVLDKVNRFSSITCFVVSSFICRYLYRYLKKKSVLRFSFKIFWRRIKELFLAFFISVILLITFLAMINWKNTSNNGLDILVTCTILFSIQILFFMWTYKIYCKYPKKSDWL